MPESVRSRRLAISIDRSEDDRSEDEHKKPSASGSSCSKETSPRPTAPPDGQSDSLQRQPGLSVPELPELPALAGESSFTPRGNGTLTPRHCLRRRGEAYNSYDGGEGSRASVESLMPMRTSSRAPPDLPRLELHTDKIKIWDCRNDDHGSPKPSLPTGPTTPGNQTWGADEASRGRTPCDTPQTENGDSRPTRRSNIYETLLAPLTAGESKGLLQGRWIPYARLRDFKISSVWHKSSSSSHAGGGDGEGSGAGASGLHRLPSHAGAHAETPGEASASGAGSRRSQVAGWVGAAWRRDHAAGEAEEITSVADSEYSDFKQASLRRSSAGHGRLDICDAPDSFHEHSNPAMPAANLAWEASEEERQGSDRQSSKGLSSTHLWGGRPPRRGGSMTSTSCLSIASSADQLARSPSRDNTTRMQDIERGYDAESRTLTELVQALHAAGIVSNPDEAPRAPLFRRSANEEAARGGRSRVHSGTALPGTPSGLPRNTARNDLKWLEARQQGGIQQPSTPRPDGSFHGGPRKLLRTFTPQEDGHPLKATRH